MSVRLPRFLVAFLGCFIAQASLGQALAPPLGTATGFALFTAGGAFNNVGPTVVKGSIGTLAGSFTGFPQGTVTGSMHIADLYAAQVATDVATAYTYLTTSTACGTTAITDLGASPAQKLLPGVYCLGGARTLTDQLVLDGGGDPDAVFVFKIGGALTTADLSTIALTNGASASNVYWQVGGRVDLGANSVFRGTIVADGAINLLTGAMLFGRGLSIAGAISLNTNMADNMLLTNPLPVTLVAFSATRQGEAVLLQWSTASESHSREFTPERSATGTTGWEPVGTLPAAGNSSTLRQYRMLDNGTRHQACYYRLRSTDIDGTFTFSSARFVAFGDITGPLAAFPNPAANVVAVTGAALGSTLMLIDMAGKVWQQTSATDNNVNYLEISKFIPNTYLLKAVSATGETTSLKLVKE